MDILTDFPFNDDIYGKLGQLSRENSYWLFYSALSNCILSSTFLVVLPKR